jgi:hypothetical protein
VSFKMTVDFTRYVPEDRILVNFSCESIKSLHLQFYLLLVMDRSH